MSDEKQLFEDVYSGIDDVAVTCLGLEFENDKARREYFTEELRKKLQDPEFRLIEGFPLGEDEDILKLSDPPYYTACPNPWIADFIGEWEGQKTEKPQDYRYHREPFAADVSEGKNDPIYNAHSYHTKVPHKAIMRYILHYTEPGDIVFDGFCGTGMTGVAAQMCGDREIVQSLGYRVDRDGTILQEGEDEGGKKQWQAFSKLGARKAVLNDLSPAATFIAYNYNTSVDVSAFEREAKRILQEVEEECGWMYETLHIPSVPPSPVGQASSLSQYGISQEFKQTRRHLPHLHYSGAIFFITFNTYNKIQLSEEAKDEIFSALKYWDGTKMELISAVVMSDHVHVLLELPESEAEDVGDLSKLMHSIKSYSANKMNKAMNREGVIWQSESYDRIVRGGKDFDNMLRYIWYNPVKAGYCEYAEDYKWYYLYDETVSLPPPVGQASAPFSVGQASAPFSVGQASAPFSVGQASAPFSVGQASAPFSVGQASAPFSVGQASAPFSVGQASAPFSVGQASSLSTDATSVPQNETGKMPVPRDDGNETGKMPVPRDDGNETGKMPVLHREDEKGRINYMVWSDVFVCPECTREIVFWEVAVDKDKGGVLDTFPCPYCTAELTKRKMDRAWTTKFDSVLNDTVTQAKQVPVLINYSVGKKRYEKTPDESDLALIETIEKSDIPYSFPKVRMMEGQETRRNDPSGITHVHHFYTKRNLYILSLIKEKCKNDYRTRLMFNSQLINVSRLNRYRPGVSFPYNPLSGTMYIGSQISEANVFIAFYNKINRLINAFNKLPSCSKLDDSGIGTVSATDVGSCKADYIFLDPPFGSNLNYSELNFLWEAWLKVFTNNKPEAIENKVQGKGLTEYHQLMKSCFAEAYRVLKPGRWMTVEFSNTKSSVWNSIQDAITKAGFIVANVSALDKQQGSFKAVTTPTAVKQDLVISAYKPNGGFEERFVKNAETEEGVWDFIRTHLARLPVIKKEGVSPSVGQASSLPTGKMPVLQFISERDPRILYDQVVAYYVRKGYNLPIDSKEFQNGLDQRFSERDGMYFLEGQIAAYDRQKMLSGSQLVQPPLFVCDESSSIEWLRKLLREKPQKYQDIQPVFMQTIHWSKHEVTLELKTLLDQNFLCYEGKDKEPVPSQIHGYLSSNWPDMRNLKKDSPKLMEKAKGRWYMPDPNKTADLEKLREKSLLRDFEVYKQEKKKLKQFRIEAVRAGFKIAYQQRDYQVIIDFAQKIPPDVLEGDPKLLMYYDLATTRTQG